MADIAAKRAEDKGKGCERRATLYNLGQTAVTMSIYKESDFASPEKLEAVRDGLKV